MQGTSWLMRTVQTFAALERSFKALPAPAQLYQNSAAPAAYPLTFPGWQQWERDYAQGNKDLANAKTAVTSPWVFSDLTAIANEAIAAELQVEEKRGKTWERIEDHPLEQIWQSPNDFMGQAYVTSFWFWSYKLASKAYLYWVVPNGAAEPVEVWPIPPWMIAPAKDPKTFIKGYAFKTRPDADPIFIPADRITFSRSVNIFDAHDGLSFLVAAMLGIKGGLAAEAWNHNFFSEQNGIPDGMISLKVDTLDTDVARVRMELKDFFGGTRRGIAVARAGDMKYEPWGRSQKDAEFLGYIKQVENAVDRTLGFPSGYWSERANRANAEQARATMIAGAVWPSLLMLSQDMSAQTVKRWWTNTRATFKDIRPENLELKMAEFDRAAKVMTVEELRDKFWQLKSIGDVRDRMLLAEIDKGAATPTSAPSLETEQILSEMEADLPEEAAPPEDEGAPPVPEDAAVAEGEPVEEMKALDLDKWERKAIKALRAKGRATCVFASDAIDADARATIAAGLAECRTPQEVRAVFRPFTETKAAPALDARLAAILERARRRAVAAIMQGGEPDLSRLEQELTAALQAELTQAVLAGVSFQGAAFGVALDNASALAAEWAASYVPGAVRGMTDVTRAGLEAAIAQYRSTPMSREDLIKVVGGLFGPDRAELIAQTESVRAQSASTVAIRKYLEGHGLSYDYVWETSNDERQCSLCLPLNGQVVPETELPPRHPRCRCRVTLRAKGATKHLPGGHDQRSHGRSTARRSAARAAYSGARAGGASIAEARRAARDVSQTYAAQQRLANIEKQLSGQVSDGQRASLEAERARLQGEIATRSARTPAAAQVPTAEANVRGRQKQDDFDVWAGVLEAGAAAERRATKPKKPVTLRVADHDAIYNRINNDPKRLAKLEREAAQAGEHPYWHSLNKTARRIGYGAVRVDRWWHPVRDGEVDRRDSYQFSTAAYNVASHNVATNGRVQHIED